jgi:hypothetical protein
MNPFSFLFGKKKEEEFQTPARPQTPISGLSALSSLQKATQEREQKMSVLQGVVKKEKAEQKLQTDLATLSKPQVLFGKPNYFDNKEEAARTNKLAFLQEQVKELTPGKQGQADALKKIYEEDVSSSMGDLKSKLTGGQGAKGFLEGVLGYKDFKRDLAGKEKAPTAKKLAEGEVIQELIARGDLEKRQPSIPAALGRGAERGVSFGLLEPTNRHDLITQAQFIETPLTTGEKAGEIGGELAGGMIPYAGISGIVGRNLRTVAAIDRYAVRHPFLYGALIRNLGEEGVDAAIRIGSGQEYGPMNAVFGLLGGGIFEGVGRGIFVVRNGKRVKVQLADVQDDIMGQLNDLVGKLDNPTVENIYKAVENVPILKSDMTFGDLFGERRLLAQRPRDSASVMGERRPAGLEGPEQPRAPGEAQPLPGMEKLPEPERVKNPDSSLIDEDTPASATKEVRAAYDNFVKQKDVTPTKKSKKKDTVRGDAKNLKDITTVRRGFDTFHRATRKALGEGSWVERNILDPLDDAKGALVDQRDALKASLKENVVDKYKIRRKSKESADLQRWGEKELSTEELTAKYGEKRAGEIMAAESWFRETYDDLLRQYNQTMAQIYPNNPEKQVPKRKDYFHHFQEMNEGIIALRNIIESPSGISPELSGKSASTVPFSRFVPFAQKRRGNKTTYDAVEGALIYIDDATYGIHINPFIGKIRAARELLAEQAGVTKDKNTYIATMYDFANYLAGKSPSFDRFVFDNIIGRKGTLRIAEFFNNRAKQNTILGNARNLIMQNGNVPMAIGTIKNPMIVRRALQQTMLGTVYESPHRAKSTFLKERFAGRAKEGFEVGLREKSRKVAASATQTADRLPTEFIWEMGYERALRQGSLEPWRDADKFTRDMVGGRGVGELSPMQQNKMTQLIAPFQLEVTNAMMHLKDQAAKGDVVAVGGILAGNWLFNEGLEKLTGSRGLYDPIDALLDAISEIEDDDTKLKIIYRIAGRQVGEFIGNIPFGQTLATLAMGGAPHFSKQLFGDTDPTRFGTGLVTPLVTGIAQAGYKFADEDYRGAALALKKVAFRILPPFAGVQLEKSIDGYLAYRKGEVENAAGKHMYDVKQSPSSFIQNIVFGKYSTPEARAYFRTQNGQKSLSEMIKALDEALYPPADPIPGMRTSGSRPSRPARPSRPERPSRPSPLRPR